MVQLTILISLVPSVSIDSLYDAMGLFGQGVYAEIIGPIAGLRIDTSSELCQMY